MASRVITEKMASFAIREKSSYHHIFPCLPAFSTQSHLFSIQVIIYIHNKLLSPQSSTLGKIIIPYKNPVNVTKLQRSRV